MGTIPSTSYLSHNSVDTFTNVLLLLYMYVVIPKLFKA